MNPDELRKKSKDIWEEMAPGWERRSEEIWESTKQVSQWMVDRLEPHPGETVLDLAAGPGDTGFLAARLLGAAGKLISSDFSPKMVDVASRRAGELGISNGEFRVLDAEKMDLATESVDGVLCRFGYMLMIDPVAAFKETRRVLRPNGRLAFAVWGAPQDNPWALVPGITAVGLGLMEPPNPNAPGGVFSLAEEATIEGHLTKAGLSLKELERIPVTFTYDSFDDLWSMLNEVAGALAQVIRGLSKADAERLKDELRTNGAAFRSGESYEMPGVAISVLAV